MNDSSGSSYYNTPCESPSSYSDVESTSFPIFSSVHTDLPSPTSNHIGFDSVDTSERASTILGYSSERVGSNSSSYSVETTRTLITGGDSKAFSNFEMERKLPQMASLQQKLTNFHITSNGSTGNADVIQLAFQKLQELNANTFKLAGLEKQVELIGAQLAAVRTDISSKTTELSNILCSFRLEEPVKKEQATPSTSQGPRNPDAHKRLSVVHQMKATPLPKVMRTPEINVLKETNPKVAAKGPTSVLTLLTPSLKHKLRRLPALVKGYLTRRIFHTNHVQDIIKTIKDTEHELIVFNPEDVRSANDILLHQSLMNQLNKSCADFYYSFFNPSTLERMRLISRSRERLREQIFSRPSTRFSVVSQDFLLTSSSSGSPKKGGSNGFVAPSNPLPTQRDPKVAGNTVTKRVKKTVMPCNENRSPPARKKREPQAPIEERRVTRKTRTAAARD